MSHPIRRLALAVVIALVLVHSSPLFQPSHSTPSTAAATVATPEGATTDPHPLERHQRASVWADDGGTVPNVPLPSEPQSPSVSDEQLHALTDAFVDASKEPASTGVVFLVAYRDRSDSDLFENDTRRAIYEHIQAEPGMYLSELADRIEISLPTVRYHTRILEDESHLTGVRYRGTYRLYPVEASSADLQAAFDHDITARLLVSIAHHEPVSVSTLADDVERAESTVSYHLKRLAEDDLVERERAGRAVLTTLTPTVRTRLALDGSADRSESNTR